MEIEFTGARALVAEGARVALVTCLECGAALVLDPADEKDPLELHREWHARLDARLSALSGQVAGLDARTIGSVRIGGQGPDRPPGEPW